MRRRALTTLLALPLAAGATTTTLLDDFADARPWVASASEGVRASVERARDGGLCLVADFGRVSGYAVLRRTLPIAWPAHFDLLVQASGDGAVNELQLKFVDASGANVWWFRRPDPRPPRGAAGWRVPARQLEFAWGPTADRTLRATQDVELVIAAGRDGGRSRVCLRRLELVERAPDPSPWPEPTAVQAPGRLDLALHHPRDFNGIALRWPAGVRRVDYEVLASDDARRWRLLRRVRGSDGGLDALYLPDERAAHLRVRTAAGVPLPTIALREPAQWPDLNATVAELAADAPRGELPRAFLGEQNHWTLVGVDAGGPRSALIDEDGALELGHRGPSVEPSVAVDGGAPVGWAGVEATQRLREDALPIPSVHWRHPAFTLAVEAAADGPPGRPHLLARYTVRNTDTRPHRLTLQLALRPWQVNPPQQFLNTPGGVRPIGRLQWDGQRLVADGRTALRPTTAPEAVTALGLDGGVSLAALQAAPLLGTLDDPQGHASALLRWTFELAPGAQATVGFSAPLSEASTDAPALGADALAARLDTLAAEWSRRLVPGLLQLPAPAAEIAATLRTALAHMLVSRDAWALQPGTRSYARSWIRDGAMMVAGLVRLSELAVAREFVDGFAAHIFPSGRVPCCVDRRGADPVAEHDSQGQYLFAVADVWRHGGDAAFLARHWPQVERVVERMEAMRQSERGDANRVPGRAHLFGLLPPSISHEGYSDRPAYAYWDDFWAVRGYKDAVQIAQALGHGDAARRWAEAGAQFERELGASIVASAAHHGIGFVPGAADRGDFDATSTTVALDPAQAGALVPPALLDATFERYWQHAEARRTGSAPWRDFTPYEWRNVGALLRLGRADRALALLDFLMAYRRPAAWNQWAEVVRPGLRDVGFVGDMPHAWIASDALRALLDLFAYEREVPAQVVIGAGIAPAWRDAGPIVLRGLNTTAGPLDYTLAPAADGWRLDLARAGLPVRLAWPPGEPLPEARHDGRPIAWDGRELPLPPAPSSVTLTRRAAAASTPARP